MSVPNPRAVAAMLADHLDGAIDGSDSWEVTARAADNTVGLDVEHDEGVYKCRAVVVEGDTVPVIAPRPDITNGLELEGVSFHDDAAPGWQVVPYNSAAGQTCMLADADSVLIRGAQYMPVDGAGHISWAEVRRMGAALLALADAHERAQAGGGSDA